MPLHGNEVKMQTGDQPEVTDAELLEGHSASYRLSEIVQKHTGIFVSPTKIEGMFERDFKRISRLTHLIHEGR